MYRTAKALCILTFLRRCTHIHGGSAQLSLSGEGFWAAAAP